MSPESGTPYFSIARIVRTRGIRGEVLGELHTDFPDRFDSLHQVWIEFPGGAREIFLLQESWEHKGRRVLKFAGVDSIESAQKLVGGWVQVEAREAVSLPEGTYFDHDLVGCRLENEGGEFLGTVSGVLRIPGNAQLVVRGPHGEYMVPAIGAICREVSIGRKRIRVDLPGGLLDLNK